MVEYMLQDNTNHPIPDWAYALGIKENLFSKQHSKGNNGKVVNHAFPACHILQQTAAAADNQIRGKNRTADTGNAEPWHRMNAKRSGGRFGISGDHRNIRRVKGSLECLQNGRKHGFITGIIEAIITGNDDFIICHIFLRKTWSAGPES